MKKKKGKKVILIIIAVAVVLGIVIKLALPAKPDSGSESFMGDGVLVQPLQKQDLSNSINTSGVVQSQNVYQVTTEVTCKVKELPVALGDHVEVGDTLCVFDDTELQEQIKNLEAQMSTSEKLAAKQKEIAQRNLKEAKDDQTTQMNRANDAIASAQAEYEKAVKDLDAAKASLQNAQAEYDQSVKTVEDAKAAGSDTTDAEQAVYSAKTNLEQAKSDVAMKEDVVSASQKAIDSAKEALSETQKQTNSSIQSMQDQLDTDALSQSGDSDASKELAKLYRQLNEMTITAQQAGIITKLNISNGSIPNGVLMQIEDDKNLKVNVSIKERDILKMKTDMPAKVKTDAIAGEEYAGVVSKVINFASSSADVNGMGDGSTGANYSAEIKINPGTKLLLGMTVKVEITTNSVGEEIAVAYDSILQDENGQSFVYRAILQDDGTYIAEKIPVTVGESNDYYTAVKSDSLQEGDLIVGDPTFVEPDQVISIYNPEETDSSSYDMK